MRTQQQIGKAGRNYWLVASSADEPPANIHFAGLHLPYDYKSHLPGGVVRATDLRSIARYDFLPYPPRAANAVYDSAGARLTMGHKARSARYRFLRDSWRG